MDPIYIILIVLVVALGIVALAVRSRRAPGGLPAPASGIQKPALAVRLAKTRAALGGRLRSLFAGSMDAAFWEGLEEALIAADVGVTASAEVVGRVREGNPADTGDARRALRDELLGLLPREGRALDLVGDPAVVIVVGVNGTGKTTSIAKLGKRFQDDGLSVVFGAADTYRAAAVDQLEIWAERLSIPIIAGQMGGDAGAVAYDSVISAQARGANVLLIDTAGRLHTRFNLMEELRKVHRVVGKAMPGAPHHVWLVMDATTGQNGLLQARAFKDAVHVGLIINTAFGQLYPYTLIDHALDNRSFFFRFSSTTT